MVSCFSLPDVILEGSDSNSQLRYVTDSSQLELFFYKKTDVSPFKESKKSKHQ